MKTVLIALKLIFFQTIIFAQTKSEKEFISFLKSTLSEACKTGDTIIFSCIAGNKFRSRKWDALFLCKKTKVKIELFSQSNSAKSINDTTTQVQILDTTYITNSTNIYNWLDKEKIFLSRRFVTSGSFQDYIIEYKNQESHFLLPAHGLFLNAAILNNFKR